MLPTSIAGSMRIGVPVDRVARLDAAHVGALEREVAAGLDAAQVGVGALAPVT